MSGLVAVVPVTGGATQGPDVAQELRALAETFARLREEVCTELTGDEPTRHGGPAVAVAGGHLVSDDAGWTAFHGSRHVDAGADAHHPVAVADLAAADGQHALVSYDVRRGTTVVATDRFAAAPVYLAERDGLLYVATSALVLAAHLRPAVDADHAGAFVVAGYQFGTSTHWHGVRRLPPGSAVEVRDGRCTESTWWRPTVDRAVEALSLDDATDHLIEVATRTYRERLSGEKTWIDLTGGYDSRLMALLLERAGVPFVGNTRMSSLGPDLELAQELAQLKGWEWEARPLPQDWPEKVPHELDRSLAAGDARLEVLQLSRVQSIHRAMAERHPRLLSAGGGEHLQYYAWSTELLSPPRRTADIGRWVDMIALKPSGPEVVAPGVRAATRSAFVATLGAEAGHYAAEPSSRQLDACYAYKSGGHFGAYRAADDIDLTAQLPFYFEPVFSAAFSVRRRHRAGFRLMRRMMERLDPAAAALETTRGGPALPMRPTTFGRYLPYYRLLGRKGVNKLSGQLVGRPLMPLPHSYAWPRAESDRAAVAHLQERGTLDWDALRVRPLLSPAGVDLLRRHESSSDTLGRVLTVEMALAATDTGL